MEIAEIKTRIEKKQAALEKAKRLADKYMANFDDEDKNLIAGSIGSWSTFQKVVAPALTDKYGNDWGYDVKGRDANAARTNLGKVEEAELQLEKYKNALNAAEVKQGKLDAPRIKVIIDFLESWKQKVTNYTVKNMEVYEEYLKADHEETEWFNHRGWLTSERNAEAITKEEWTDKYNELKKKTKELKASVAPLTTAVRDRTVEDHVDHEELSKILDKEADDIYLEMVEKVTAITGEITDASGLYISPKGDLNGMIFGDKGTAKIQTIGAGGYNIQRYHFRTLIKSI